MAQVCECKRDCKQIEKGSWCNKMTYTVYSNDDISELPSTIIKQMIDYLQSELDYKAKV